MCNYAENTLQTLCYTRKKPSENITREMNTACTEPSPSGHSLV